MASSGASAGSPNSNSVESLKEAQSADEEPSPSNGGDQHYYDLPPSYEEALGSEDAQSPHRYCEIDDLVVNEPDAAGAEAVGACGVFDKAESPIYAVIDDILPSKEDSKKEQQVSTENNVNKARESCIA